MSDIGNPPPAESSNSNSNSNTASRMLQSPLHSPGSGKIVPSASTASFLATTALVPVWAATVLPLSVIYQLGRAAALRILALAGWSPDGGTPHQPLDSGYSVADSVPVPRPDRKYDLVVLGATGFTGRLAARHLAKTYYDNNSNHNRLSGNDGVVKWAIAGRSASKLDAVKRALALELGLADADAFCRTVDSLVVDTSDPASVGAMVRQTRVVATTVGPYTLYGNSVVECCAKLGTHYVDITGEVDWVKAMLCQWQATAQESGAKIISFCGHGTYDDGRAHELWMCACLFCFTFSKG